MDFLYLVLSVFYLPTFLFKGKHRPGFRQRCGIYSPDILKALSDKKPVLWLHAVSVGEIKAAAPLLDLIREKFATIKIIISTITPTGNSIAHQLAKDQDVVIYFPFDFSFIVKKVLSLINPRLLLIMETELWPNMILEAKKRDIPVAIINGRISNKAFPRYRLGAVFFKRILKKIDLFCMQTEIDVKRIISLGADKQRVHLTGNLKFDQGRHLSNKNIPNLALGEEELLIVAGSTHEKEEEIIAQVFIKLKNHYPKIRLLIAPRHPHRAKEIERSLKNNSLESIFVSQLEQNRAALKEDTVFILDMMGVLNQFYRLADIVFVGGSLVAHGGHNPIEPAAQGKPVVFGRYMFNFAQITECFLNRKAALCVKDESGLYDALNELLRSVDKRRELAQAAQAVVMQNQGSAGRVMKFLKENVMDAFRID